MSQQRALAAKIANITLGFIKSTVRKLGQDHPSTQHYWDTPGVLGSVGQTELSPANSHKDDRGTEALVIQGQAEKTGVVQAKEKAQGSV